MNKLPYGARYSRDEKGELHVEPEGWIDMSKTYHTDLDRDDFAPGELLPWQDMSRHLQALEHQVQDHHSTLQSNLMTFQGLIDRIVTLEKALQTTTDSLKQAHEKIAWHEERIGIEYKPVEETYEGECERCGRLGPLNKGGLCKGCVLDDIMYPGRAN